MKFQFKKDVKEDEKVFMDLRLMDIFYEAYLKPEILLDSVAQTTIVMNAIKIVKDFIVQAEKAGVIELG